MYSVDEVSSFAVEFIADEAVFPVCSPSFADALPPSLAPADLAQLSLLHVEYQDPSWITWSQFLEHFGATEQRDRRVVTSYNVGLDMAEQGEGLALGWQRSVQARLDSGVLVRVPGFVMPKPGVINAYLPKHTAVNPFASPFVAILKDTLGTTQAG